LFRLLSISLAYGSQQAPGRIETRAFAGGRQGLFRDCPRSGLSGRFMNFDRCAGFRPMGRFLKALPCAHSTGDFGKYEELD
jgi:hypothetical protein